MPSRLSNTNKCILKLNPSLIDFISFETPDYKLEVTVVGTIGVVGDGSRLVADDPFSILKIHSVGLAPKFITHPVKPSLKNNCSILVEHLESK